MKSSVIKGLLLVGVLTASANAAIDVSSIALETTQVEVLAMAMLGALGIIWVARKVVGFLR